MYMYYHSPPWQNRAIKLSFTHHKSVFASAKKAMRDIIPWGGNKDTQKCYSLFSDDDFDTIFSKSHCSARLLHKASDTYLNCFESFHTSPCPICSCPFLVDFDQAINERPPSFKKPENTLLLYFRRRLDPVFAPEEFFHDQFSIRLKSRNHGYPSHEKGFSGTSLI